MLTKLSLVLILGCSGVSEPSRPMVTSPEMGAMRRALGGAQGLSDEDVRFIHKSLRRSNSEYTNDGLLTYVEWELVATVGTTADHYTLDVAGPNVNAVWTLTINRNSGEVTEVMVGTLEVSEMDTLRRGLQGSLSDDEVRFIHQSLLRSSTEYTAEGLLTYVEWELVATVQSTPERYELLVAGPRVNAEWVLTIDRRTGDVTEGMVATLAEPE